MKTGFKNVGLFVAGAAIMLGVVWYVERNKANQTGKVIETGSSVSCLKMQILCGHHLLRFHKTLILSMQLKEQ